MDLSPQHHGNLSFEKLPPELQQEIFSHFNEDNKSLFAIVRVNKAWYHNCIGMLWRKSTQGRLRKISTQERLQHYASMISHWDLDDRDCPSECFNGLDFPMLKELSLGSVPFQLCSSVTVCQRNCIRSNSHIVSSMR